MRKVSPGEVKCLTQSTVLMNDKSGLSPGGPRPAQGLPVRIDGHTCDAELRSIAWLQCPCLSPIVYSSDKSHLFFFYLSVALLAIFSSLYTPVLPHLKDIVSKPYVRAPWSSIGISWDLLILL